MTKNNTDEVKEIIKVMPGITAREIYELMPHASKGGVSSALHNLKARGEVSIGTKVLPTKIGYRRFVTYTLCEEPCPVTRPRKLKNPTEAGLKATIDGLRAKLAELEAWKEAAIARFPDLAVPDVVVKARKLVAQELRAGGDHSLADQVVAGHKDETMLVRVTIKALEEADIS